MDNAVETVESDEIRDKLQMIRVKSLRLAQRLGLTPSNDAVAQMLYRLGLAEQFQGGRADTFSFNRAWAMAEQSELAGEPLDFSCTILVLGKSGVGKSATINSIFDQVMFGTDAFQLETKKVKDAVGTVNGIKVRVIDTPGLSPLWSDQQRNRKILHSVKRFIGKSPPDIVLYFDRLNMHDRDLVDMPLLQTINSTFSPSVWMNTIVVLTHAASAPPEGPNGAATNYNTYVNRRSDALQRAIRQASKVVQLMNPVTLVENHFACRTNRAGQRVLPNGLAWKPRLLMLSFASKILDEANELLKSQNGALGGPYIAQPRLPPLQIFLSSLLQSKPKLKLPHDEQYVIGDETLDDDLDELLNSDDELEYDELPPFKPLSRARVAKLSKSQKKAYYDELDYREKLYMKKQLRDSKQWRMMKKMEAEAKELPSDHSNDSMKETEGEAYYVVNLPVPTSFNSDDPVHRYRFLHNSNQLIAMPVQYSGSWDHDDGYAGVIMNSSFEAINKVPMSFTGQIKKDKKEALFTMEVTGLVKHDETKETTVSFDVQPIERDIAYTIRSDTKFSNFRRNKTTAGLSVTRMGDALTAGVKVEDKIMVSRRAQVVMTGGATAYGRNVAYGGSLEATLRDIDFPLGRSLSTMSFSTVQWSCGFVSIWNAKTQIPIGRFTDLIGSLNLNDRGEGQVSIRLKSSKHPHLTLVGLVPLLSKLLTMLFRSSLSLNHLFYNLDF
ncbi:translocase of chloroplast 120, chloroplastic-like [Heracleum sosnowskyi]|uniref:Translocase of chloroplast 120, chloroplastic-like n=1 Tax=Heracleum sosnowskyi TaxID=360622 RepID=A0AAD8J2T3_9APIA|nr:translocase of chloroplast 120, chloroplastic-like [Heracleum sosnowskyi]